MTTTPALMGFDTIEIKLVFSKSCQITISLKSEKNYHVFYAKYCMIIIMGVGLNPLRIILHHQTTELSP